MTVYAAISVAAVLTGEFARLEAASQLVTHILSCI